MAETQEFTEQELTNPKIKSLKDQLLPRPPSFEETLDRILIVDNVPVVEVSSERLPKLKAVLNKVFAPSNSGIRIVENGVTIPVNPQDPTQTQG
jgi:hypothetical protein